VSGASILGVQDDSRLLPKAAKDNFEQARRAFTKDLPKCHTLLKKRPSLSAPAGEWAPPSLGSWPGKGLGLRSTDTDLFNEGKSEADRARMASMAAFNRQGTPQEFADVVTFLVSDDSGRVSGQNIRANGGLI